MTSVGTIIRSKPFGSQNMNMGDWLRSLGLDQYETTFRDNGIDADVLFELTEADFEKLGVLLGTPQAADQSNRHI